jgi:hypothetical protein
MSHVNVRPKWWLLYLTFPLLIALFILEERLQLSAGMHQALQIGIVFLVYGLIHWWLKANARALSNMDQAPYRESIIVSRVPLRRLPHTHPMFVFPDAEIKGTLSDTFEMDVIDAEFLPSMDSVTDLKKE